MAAVVLVGGVHPRTQVGLSAAALVLTLTYAVMRGRRGLRVVAFALPAALAVAVTILQLVPLPAALVHVLSPEAWATRVDAIGAVPSWMSLTLDVPATVLEVVKGLACLGVLLIIGTLARPLQRTHRLLLVIALTGGAVAILSMVQHATGATTILGLHRPRTVTGNGIWGTLVNGNHAASLFTLAALVSFGLALETAGARRFLLLWAGAACVGGVLLTTSRGGALGLAVGGGLFAGVLAVRKLGRTQGLLAAGALAVLLGAGGLWLADGLRARLSQGGVGELLDNPKTRGWRDGLKLAGHYPWTGVGRGAFEAPLEAWRADDEGVRLVYPESWLVQLTSEWGVPIAAGLMLLVGLAAARMVRRGGKLEPGTLAAGCGVLAVVVHDLTDFGLEMPGIALPTVIALGVFVARVDEKGARAPERMTRVPLVATGAVCAGWLVVLGAGWWAASHTLTADSDRIAAMWHAHDPELATALDAAARRHPAADYFALVAAEDALLHKDPAALRHVNRALRVHPAGLGHRIAARTLAAMGHRAQAALEYRRSHECGVPLGYDEIWRVTGDSIIEAVPQRPSELVELATWLSKKRRPKVADQVCRRAEELAPPTEALLAQCLQIAVEGGEKPLILGAVRTLVESTPSVHSYAQAAQALQQIGDAAGADQLIVQGQKAHPEDTTLLLVGGRLKFERGDLAGAREFLRRPTQGILTLTDRKSIEDLIAEIADRTGDVDGALLARSRSRVLERQMSPAN